MKNSLRGMAAIGVLLGCAATSMAQTVTVASFSDPSGSAVDNPLFIMAADMSTIEGSWTGLTLNLPFNAQSYQDVTLSMPLMTAKPDGKFEGYFEFLQNNQTIMRFDFQSATLSEFGFAARNLTASATNVDLLYPYPASYDWTRESFSFAFGSFDELVDGRWGATAAFTSAAIIPEPATLAVMGLGALACLRRRRR